eukprot:gene18043-21538_t
MTSLTPTERARVSEVFGTVKPLADQIVAALTEKRLTEDHVRTRETLATVEHVLHMLCGIVDRFDGVVALAMLDYINIPLMMLFSQHAPAADTVARKESVQLLALQLLRTLLSRLPLVHFTYFVDTLKMVIGMLISPATPLSDERVTAVLATIRMLFSTSEQAFIKDPDTYSSEEAFIGIGFAISTLLDRLKDASSPRAIKIEVVATMNTILAPLMANHLAYRGTLSRLFPATIIGLHRVLVADYKLGTSLKCATLSLFSALIVATQGDDYSATDQFLQVDYIKDNFALVANGKGAPREVSEIERNLHRICCTIFPSSGSYSKLCGPGSLPIPSIESVKWQMREGLVSAASSIAKSCANTLPTIIPLLTETLVLHTTDEYPSISQTARDNLISLAQASPVIREAIATNFANLLQALPRLICGADVTSSSLDEANKATVARLATAYVSQLADASSILATRLDQVASTLVQILEMTSPSTTNTALVDGTTTARQSLQDALQIVRTDGGPQPRATRAKPTVQSRGLSLPYLYFTSETVEHQLLALVRHLGGSIDLMSWVDVFLSNSPLARSPRRKEILLILNQVMQGASSNSTPVDFSTLMYILDEIMSPELTNLPMTRPPNDALSALTSQSHILEQLYDNAIVQSLIIDGIGHIGTLLSANKKHRSIFIGKVIYHLLEKFGTCSEDPSGLLLRACTTTLNKLTTVLNYDSLEDIVYKNSNYLLDTIESNMKYLGSHPNTPNVFAGILAITGLGFLPFLKDTVEMILFALDVSTQNSDSIGIFIRILYNIIKVLHDNAKKELDYRRHVGARDGRKVETMVVEDTRVDKTGAKIDDINSEIGIERKLVVVSDLDKEDGEIKKDFKETTESERKLLCDIIQKCKHFVASRDKSVKITTMDIIGMSLVVVSTSSKRYGSDEDQEEDEDDGGQASKPVGTEKQPKVALFPLIHSVWPTIVKRAIDADRVTSRRALELIQSIAVLANDFISQRYWSDLFPGLKRMLLAELSANSKSTLKPVGKADKFTASYKIQSV